MIAHPNFMNLGPGEGFTLAIGCQVDDTQVNTKCFISLYLFRSLLALSHIQVVCTASPYEISSTDLPGLVNQHIILTFTQDHAANHTPLNGIEGDTIKTQKAIGTGIIADRATWPELRTRFAFLALCGFDRLNGFGTSTHSQLSTQRETGTSLTIDTVMSRVGVSDMLIPANRGNPRSRFVKTLLRLSQGGFMFTDIQLNTDSSYEHIVH